MESIPSAYYFGEFTLDVGKGCVLKGQEEIKLRPKVFEALQYFVQNSGRLIGRQSGPTASSPTIRWCSVRSNCAERSMTVSNNC